MHDLHRKRFTFSLFIWSQREPVRAICTQWAIFQMLWTFVHPYAILNDRTNSWNNNNNLLLGSFHHRRGFQKGPIKTKYSIYKQVEIYN